MGVDEDEFEEEFEEEYNHFSYSVRSVASLTTAMASVLTSSSTSLSSVIIISLWSRLSSATVSGLRSRGGHSPVCLLWTPTISGEMSCLSAIVTNICHFYVCRLDSDSIDVHGISVSASESL